MMLAFLSKTFPWHRRAHCGKVPVIGRTNVGKSSLLNALVGQDGLVKTSRQPGHTRNLNRFQLANAMMLVDVPGYGYGSKEGDMENMGLFFRRKPNIATALFLVNAQHGLKEVDEYALGLLEESNVPYQVPRVRCGGGGE
jgi:GTP-binding protein